MTLANLKIGETARVASVNGEGVLRCRLLDMGILPSTLVTIKKKAPMGDPVEIQIRGYLLTLRAHEADTIEVEKI